MAKKEISMDALKNYVRQEADRFLKDGNITSVGVGYKISDGKKTRQLSIQFTVAQKVGLEGLEALGTEELPTSVNIDGFDVPTDVLQRSYAAHLRPVNVVARIEAAADRKGVADPVTPGVSIGHPSISAGTVGCVVYDATSGQPYVLSNWHVLSGDAGQAGDAIAQPGRHDDSRTDRNTVGKLVRSHLGPAGDCAIATIERRALDPTILELGVAVRRIAEPELEDKVVKSGRTTGVTYGEVSRVHVVTPIHYGAAGVHQIGGFEIVPDPERPAADGEISKGGDSGAAWLALEGGRPTDILVGLHFAGEVGEGPETALACYAASVFEKLNVLPAPPVPRGNVAGSGMGYDPDFLGVPVPAPRPAGRVVAEDLLTVEGRTTVDYTHFSLAMSRSRRFAAWVAWNIDGSSLRRLDRNIPFKKDPNLPADAQVGNELYSNNDLDRGHIARRADLLWGPEADARRANKDSFFFTNITPQHASFNQSGASGIWGQLEDAVFAEVEVDNLRVSVVGGPIFTSEDPLYRGVRLPRQFFKVLYYRQAGNPALEAKAYVLTQADLLNQLEALELPEFAVYEVSFARLTELTGLELPGATAGSGPESLDGAQKTQVDVRRVRSVREILR